MRDRCVTVFDENGKHKPGDVVRINDENWVVVTVSNNGINEMATLEPLSVFIANNNYIDVEGEKITIAHHISNIACDYLLHRKEAER